MLHIWDAVEADFYRDYRIDLVEQIDRMSWRRFLVLLNNLNPHGAVSMRIQAEMAHDKEEGLDDEATADAFFASIVSL